MPPSEATRVLVVGPAFLTSLQVPILAGRDIEERDRPGSQPVAVINERFARTNFGKRNPLGRHLILSKDGNCLLLSVIDFAPVKDGNR
jgi:macrolide transport system ATP-binding/permease protein